MKKFNWKNKRLIASLLTVLLLGVGVANPGVIAPVVTEAFCAAVECEA